MTSEERRGQFILSGLISVLILLSLYTIGQYVLALGTQKLTIQTIRFVITCILCYFLYFGNSAAKWITVVLTTVNGFLGLLFAVVFVGLGVNFFVVLSVAYLMVAGTLMFSPAVNRFLEHQCGDPFMI